MRYVIITAAALALFASCTLLLPTEEIIQPCTVDEECEAGFECEDNACLPIDENAGGEGEGEGE